MNKPCYNFFSIAETKPLGWLKEQLEIQAKGLSGTLSDFWPDISDSAWIGGSAEGWERVPYWLDGFIVLAYLLDDDKLKATAKRYIDGIIAGQAEDGWICPDVDRKDYDMWGFILVLKTLTVYHRATGDNSVIEVVRCALLNLDKHIDAHIYSRTLFDWGQARWFEALIPIYWVYECTGEDWLKKLACKLRAQGFDWKALFSDDYPYDQPHEKGRWSQMNHVVNNAMMLKGNALYYLFSDNPDDLAFAEKAYKTLMAHHGMVTGIFTGDECLNGLNPFQGTELCAVAELMYSFEHLSAITGLSIWADKCEKLAFNALPATFTPDMAMHQYVQQVNQPFCMYNATPHFGTNGPEANLFGVEPNFGCCTANMHQAFPKYTASLYLYNDDTNTIVVNGYAPSALETYRFGGSVTLKQETNYPFDTAIKFTLTCESPTELTLLLRIPQWTQAFECSIDGQKSDGYYKISKKFEGKTTFTLNLPMAAKLDSLPDNTYALTRGPLIYSLNVECEMKKQSKPGEPFWMENYELFPTSRWQYVMAVDDVSALQFNTGKTLDIPFSQNGAPVRVVVPCRKVEWGVNDLVADRCPNMDSLSAETEMLEFIPYGCTMLRMTQLPNMPL